MLSQELCVFVFTCIQYTHMSTHTSRQERVSDYLCYHLSFLSVAWLSVKPCDVTSCLLSLPLSNPLTLSLSLYPPLPLSTPLLSLSPSLYPTPFSPSHSLLRLFAAAEHEQHHHLSPGQPAERRPEGSKRGKKHELSP